MQSKAPPANAAVRDAAGPVMDLTALGPACDREPATAGRLHPRPLRRFLRWRRAALAILSVALVVAVLHAPAAGHAASAGDRLVPADWNEAHPGPHDIAVLVVFDASWYASFDGGALDAAVRVIEGANARLGEGGLRLQLVESRDWEAQFASSDIHDRLRGLEEGFTPPPAGIVIGFTGPVASGEGDGTAVRHGRYLVVSHHAHNTDQNAFVLAHEVGHLLGLHHHTCPDGACFMVSRGYDPRLHWCDEHLALLRLNAGYFRYLDDQEP